MFVTHRGAKQLANGLTDDDHQCWHFIEQNIHSPWLYVSLARRLGEGTVTDMLMVGEVSTFEMFLAQSSDNLWIESVQLVSPGWLNGVGLWLMEPLVNLTEIFVEGRKVYSYVVSQGKEYVDSSTTIPTPVLNSRLVYSAQAQ